MKFILTDKQAKPPTRSTEGSIGYDLTAVSISVMNEENYGYIEYDTGVKIAHIPPGIGGFLFPRSSISKTGLIMANSVGVIDSDYRGNIKFRFKYIPGTLKYEIGDRIGQIVFMPVILEDLEQVESVEDNTARGEGGFGSTGL